jgi:hypothetical protein
LLFWGHGRRVHRVVLNLGEDLGVFGVARIERYVRYLVYATLLDEPLLNGSDLLRGYWTLVVG